MKQATWRLARKIALLRRHWWLLIHSFAVLVIVRIALYLTTYRRIATHIVLRPHDGVERDPVYLLQWSVQHASRIVPQANCLTRALALQYMLARASHSSIMRVGVAQSLDKGFEAHAWILRGGKVLIGGNEEDITRFTPIADFPLGDNPVVDPQVAER